MTDLSQRVNNTPIPTPPPQTRESGKVLAVIFAIAHIAIGALYLDACPREPYIPIYLVVMGVFSLVLALPSFLSCEGSTSVCTICNSLMSLFVSCWFIAGNVWVYRIYEPVYEVNSTCGEPYCNKTVYLFAFWSITVVYIAILVSLVVTCCFFTFACLCARADPDE